MKFFIDTADVNEIREAHELGLIDGVTTNPTLISREGRPFDEIVKEIFSIVAGPISLETVSLNAQGMVEEGKKLAQYGPQAVIKVPTTLEGLKATRLLRADDIKVNMTLCFSPTQALLAGKAGATYISPFVGRLDDVSHTGMDIIGDIITIYDNYDFETEVLVASIRNPLHVLTAALMGADVATIPFKVISQLVKHPLTDIGIEKFLADWEKVPQ